MGDEEPTTLDEYRNMTPQQRKTVRKPALQGILDAIASEDDNVSGGAVVQKLNEILKELKDMKEKNTRYDDEIKRLNDVVNDQNKVLAAQQKFLESIETSVSNKNLMQGIF